jgi:hypothetical protein
VPIETAGSANGIAFLVGGEMAFAIVAAACSSPQTTELNAGARAATLMKWVNIGMLQTAVFLAAAALYDPSHAKPIIAGGVLGGGMMYLSYMHAKAAGLASSAPPTESY